MTHLVSTYFAKVLSLSILILWSWGRHHKSRQMRLPLNYLKVFIIKTIWIKFGFEYFGIVVCFLIKTFFGLNSNNQLIIEYFWLINQKYLKEISTFLLNCSEIGLENIKIDQLKSIINWNYLKTLKSIINQKYLKMFNFPIVLINNQKYLLVLNWKLIQIVSKLFESNTFWFE